MKRIIKEIEKEIEDLKKIEEILKQFKLWFTCKSNYYQKLPDYEIQHLENLIANIDIDIRLKYSELWNVLNNYLEMIKIPNMELEKKLNKK